MCYNIKLMCPSSTTALFIIFEKGNSKEGILFISVRKGTHNYTTFTWPY